MAVATQGVKRPASNPAAALPAAKVAKGEQTVTVHSSTILYLTYKMVEGTKGNGKGLLPVQLVTMMGKGKGKGGRGAQMQGQLGWAQPFPGQVGGD